MNQGLTPTLIRNIAKALVPLATLAGIAVVAACGDDNVAPSPAGSITGEVAVEGRGLDGVNVSLPDGTTATTATDGSFRFDGLAPGTYEVSISGYPAHAAFGGTIMSVTVGTEGGLATVAFSASNTDRDALVALYNATEGPNWTTNTNWLSDRPLGEWHGVSVHGDGRVHAIYLDGNNLVGTIPPELGSLSTLWNLNLGGNRLSGSIPSELGSLSALQDLRLAFNNLAGTIPPELGSLANLWSLNLQSNNLSGSIPPELGKLDRLAYLILGSNPLTGEIPSELGDLANLQWLWLYFSELSGPIPPELGEATTLRQLYLTGNNLSGPVPPALGNLTKLQKLDMRDNEALEGPLPLALEGLPLTQLWYYNTGICVPTEASFRTWLAGIEDHQGTGVDCAATVVAVCDRTPQVRDEIIARAGRSTCQEVTDQDLAGIKWLDLSSQDISTLKDGDFGGLTSLWQLFLTGNRLETLPTGIFAGLSALERLFLGDNRFREFPPQVLGVTTLKLLWLFNNPFPPGPLPVELSRLVNLEDLAMGHLEATEIPRETFNSMKNLRKLDLRNNRLTELPPGVFDGLSNLTSLALWGNRIATLPRGVFNSTVGYSLVHLFNNPGSPFQLALTPALTGTVGASGRLIGVGITEGAPFDIEVPLRVSANGSLAASSVVIPAGERFSNQIVASRTSGSAPVTVTVDPVPAVPQVMDICNATFLCYQGFEFAAGDALVPFEGSTAAGVCDRTPQVRDAIVAGANRSNCSEVTAQDLAAIQVLNLAGPQKIFSVEDDCKADTEGKGEGVCKPRQYEALASKHVAGNGNAPEIHALLADDFEGLSGLQELYLEDNWLTGLPAEVLDPLTSLHTLNLSRNLLTSLPAGVFDNLSSLASIFAGGNKLTELPNQIFSRTPALNRVDFTDNELTALPDGVFDGLSRLQRVYFGRNRLRALPNGVFRDQTDLRDVFFQSNELEVFPAGFLNQQSELEAVAFWANRLTALPSDALRGLTKLSYVDFDYNGITQLPQGFFDGLAALQSVYFSSNGLRTLPDGIFRDLAALQTVVLSYNELTELPDEIFEGLSALRFVNLNGNRLTALPDGVFNGLSSLRYAYLLGNPGSPFRLTPVLERHDNSDPLAPGPATVKLTLAEAAPFSMSVAVKAVGGASLSQGTIRFEVGDTESSTISVNVTRAPAGVVVDVPPPSPDCDPCRFLGLEIGTGSQIVLANPPAATVTIAGAYLTQAAQNLDGTVPLVAGRDALLRVFATSDVVNSFALEGTADFYLDGAHYGKVQLDPPVDGIPLDVEEDRLAASFNGRVPGRFLRPGAEMVVVLRPKAGAAGVNLTNHSVLRIPASGRHGLDVRDVAPLDVKIVPILSSWSKNSGGNAAVANFATNLVLGSDPDNSMQYTRRYLPISELKLSLRRAYYTEADSTSAGGFGILNELQLLRHLEAGGTDQYYHGLLAFPHFRGPGWGFGGIAANIPAYTALTISHLSNGTYRGSAFGETFAHELGHDVSLRHAPGCGAGGPDWNYPHDRAVIGVWGYDVNAPELGLKSPDQHYDYMSYCGPTWVSDYYFTKSLEHLTRPGRASAMAASSSPVQKTLVLWGGVLDNGDPQLEPPLALDAPVKLPDGSGPYRISGYDERGGVLFSFDFTPDETDHGGQVFVFAIPFEKPWANALDRVTLVGPRGSTTMDRQAIDQAVVLVDRATSRVRSVVREWTGELPEAMDSETGIQVLRLRGAK